MLAALALAAAAAGSPPAAARYVADYVPATTVILEPTEICKKGYVDPDLLAVQLMVQLKMYKAIQSQSAHVALETFDGRECLDRKDGAPPVNTGEKDACAAAIVIQRMMLNLYSGYLPVQWYATQVKPALDEDDFNANVADNTIAVTTKPRGRVDDQGLDAKLVNAQAVVALARRFIDSANERVADKDGDLLAPPIIECDFVDKVQRDNPANPGETKDEFDTFDRSRIIAGTSEFGSRFARTLKYIQFRQYAGNLAYRGAKDAIEQQHATYATGRDLYATDTGFSVSLGGKISDEASAKYNRTREESIVGAIGIPLCGLFNFDGKDCKGSKVEGDDPSRVTWSYDFIPYVAIDRGFRKTKDLVGVDPDRKDKTGDSTELGMVAYFATDDLPENCLLWTWFNQDKRLANCASYHVLRGYHLKNELDGSKLDALAYRFTPLIRKSTPGLGSFSVCFNALNALCGDPDRWLRLGVLLDGRINTGWYEETGRSPGAPVPREAILRDLNRDYTRIGGRVGVLGALRFIPDFPLNFWVAYTDFEALQGFDGDLGELQTQVSVNLGSGATIALDWRNGRREDTAKRDTTYALKVGFKTK